MGITDNNNYFSSIRSDVDELYDLYHPRFPDWLFLNKRYQSFVRIESVVFKKKSYLPLFIVLLNFIVKYILNVMLIFYHSSVFHIIYSSANGLTVGLFLEVSYIPFICKVSLKTL